MQSIKFTYQGDVYEVPVCLTKEQIARHTAGWPDGIVDVETMMRSPKPENGSTIHQRRWCLAQVKSMASTRKRAKEGRPAFLGFGAALFGRSE
jgi:hypothetical protein